MYNIRGTMCELHYTQAGGFMVRIDSLSDKLKHGLLPTVSSQSSVNGPDGVQKSVIRWLRVSYFVTSFTSLRDCKNITVRHYNNINWMSFFRGGIYSSRDPTQSEPWTTTRSFTHKLLLNLKISCKTKSWYQGSSHLKTLGTRHISVKIHSSITKFTLYIEHEAEGRFTKCKQFPVEAVWQASVTSDTGGVRKSAPLPPCGFDKELVSAAVWKRSIEFVDLFVHVFTGNFGCPEAQSFVCLVFNLVMQIPIWL